ncbi:MAG: hypothetical protein NT162_02700 [Candidatus Woesebacteria bacterium]|nr:hypothetical protein [Candidatus Woesebacteria bacterium]
MKCKVFRHKKPVQRKKFDEINHLLSSLYRRVQTYSYLLFLDSRATGEKTCRKAEGEKRYSCSPMDSNRQNNCGGYYQNSQELFAQLIGRLRSNLEILFD